ncbi:9904_t:CDS:1 [Paraglomus brasilianum]|uniref:9904_t:CDS:1 n=1 Tax=Paraglomus brasilianum TaxID=144538 RepID=A0A9N9C0Q1_9GLOM|nr:9904_t:CDS:1 [Paraglomus brasilianum]
MSESTLNMRIGREIISGHSTKSGGEAKYAILLALLLAVFCSLAFISWAFPTSWWKRNEGTLTLWFQFVNHIDPVKYEVPVDSDVGDIKRIIIPNRDDEQLADVLLLSRVHGRLNPSVYARDLVDEKFPYIVYIDTIGEYMCYLIFLGRF